MAAFRRNGLRSQAPTRCAAPGHSSDVRCGRDAERSRAWLRTVRYPGELSPLFFAQKQSRSRLIRLYAHLTRRMHNLFIRLTQDAEFDLRFDIEQMYAFRLQTRE